MAVVPLLVALFNLLVAGAALTQGLRDRTRLAFAAGPAGVGLWALGWFLSVFEPGSEGAMSRLAAIGGALAVAGFAVDALAALPRRESRLLLGAGAVVAAMIFASTHMSIAEPLGSLRWLVLGRALGIGLAFVVVVARWSQLRAGNPDAALARACLLGAAATLLVFLASAGAAVLGLRTSIDPHVFLVLLAEIWTLLYIGHRKVEALSLVAHAVTYAVFSAVVAAVTAGAFALLGERVELVTVGVTVAGSLVAAALFVGAKEPLARGLLRLVFPRQARSEGALLLARGEIEALRRRLEQAERLAIAGELAATVAHEIKNPLAPIRGYAQLLLEHARTLPAGERAVLEKGLGIIQEEAERIDGRVRELLTLSRAQAATRPPGAAVELEPVLGRVLALAEVEPGVRRIERRIEAPLGRVRADPVQLESALFNLLKNAAEASPGGRIEVAARRTSSAVVITVADDGPGIAEADRDRVFTAFYSTKVGGSGLGLAIARSAIEACGGRLALRAGAERGTIAEVMLPEPAAGEAHAAEVLALAGQEKA